VLCVHRLREQAALLQVPLPAEQDLLLRVLGTSADHDLCHHAHGESCAPRKSHHGKYLWRSHVLGVITYGVRIGNWIYWTIKSSQLQVAWICTVYNSLWHALCLLSLLCLQQSSGNGLQRGRGTLLLGFRTVPNHQARQVSTNQPSITTTSSSSYFVTDGPSWCRAPIWGL
jgi:hypothetical protein